MTKGRPDWANFRRLLLPLLFAAMLVALPAGATAAEPESGNIAGTVTEVGGGNLVEVEVCAESIDKTHFKCDSTWNSGGYEITNLPVGTYKVGFWDEGGNYVIHFWEHALTWNEATPVSVTTGGTKTVDAALEHGAKIEGTVTAAATGLPVGEVEACATSGEIERCANTNAAGVYTIDGLASGRQWSVYFYAVKAEVDVVSGPYSGGPVEVVAGELEPPKVNAQLGPGGQITGTVRVAGTGATVGGVLVCVTTATSPQPLACLRTPSSGAYRFTRVWPGSFKVAFSPELKELFGPEHLVEAETVEAAEGLSPDSYPTQWWSGQAGFGTAAPIEITPPRIVTGIDASLVAPPTPAAPAADPAPLVKKPLLKCKRGFVKRKIHGKQRCVKRHPAKPKPRHKRRGTKHQASQSHPRRP